MPVRSVRSPGRSGARLVKARPRCPGRHAGWRAALALGVASVMAGAASPAVAQAAPPTLLPTVTVSLPNTPVGKQAQWFVAAVTHLPIPTAEVKAHFDSAVLAVLTPEQLNTSLKGVTAVQVDAITTNTPEVLVFVATVNGTTKLSVTIAVDPHGLISALRLTPAGAPPAPPVPSTWAGVDRMVRSVAPDVHFLVAAISGNTCRPVQAMDAAAPAPLGSAFKLYVLEALAKAIAAGKVGLRPGSSPSPARSRACLPGFFRTTPMAPVSACSRWRRA